MQPSTRHAITFQLGFSTKSILVKQFENFCRESQNSPDDTETTNQNCGERILPETRIFNVPTCVVRVMMTQRRASIIIHRSMKIDRVACRLPIYCSMRNRIPGDK